MKNGQLSNLISHLSLIILYAIVFYITFPSIGISENAFYWLFSTTAQAVAAIIGLVVAGYGFSLSQTDSSLYDDDINIEWITSLREKRFNIISNAIVIAFGAILFSLISILYGDGVPNLLLASITSSLVLYALYISLKAAYNLFNPKILHDIVRDRIKSVATQYPDVDSTNLKNTAKDLISSFARIENLIRIIALENKLYSEGVRGRRPGMLKLVELVSASGFITPSEAELLLKIHPIRNMIAHGAMPFTETIDSSIIEDISGLYQRLRIDSKNINEKYLDGGE